MAEGWSRRSVLPSRLVGGGRCLRVLAASIATLAVASWLQACSPTHDWREIRPVSSDALVLFPCKPASHARDVNLPSTGAVRMTMHACQVGSTTYATMHFRASTPAQVGAALEQLRQAALANTRADPGTVVALPLPARQGATPYAQAGTWQWTGKLADGQPALQAVTLAARGLEVMQVSTLQAGASASQRDAEAVRTFLESLKWPG